MSRHPASDREIIVHCTIITRPAFLSMALARPMATFGEMCAPVNSAWRRRRLPNRSYNQRNDMTTRRDIRWFSFFSSGSSWDVQTFSLISTLVFCNPSEQLVGTAVFNSLLNLAYFSTDFDQSWTNNHDLMQDEKAWLAGEILKKLFWRPRLATIPMTLGFRSEPPVSFVGQPKNNVLCLTYKISIFGDSDALLMQVDSAWCAHPS